MMTANMRLLSCSLLWFFRFLFVQGKTNLFGGFSNPNKNDRDGLSLEGDVPTATLSNGIVLPLVGLGCGNLQKDRIETMTYEGLKSDHRIHLIDTAQISQNGKEVSTGVVTGVKRFKEQQGINKDDRIQVHVITKVWYTHLGYERTKIAVEESLKEFSEAIKDPNVDLKVHVLIHWSRCYDSIDWMDCEGEENALPTYVKNAGPPPHLDKENAWKGSWKALEDMYNSADYPPIVGIGISNFVESDVEELVTMARVVPHIYQMNVWSLLNDPQLVDVCNRNNIHIQLFNIMNGILGHAFQAPHALHHLLMVANNLRKESAKAGKGITRITAAQVVLKWLVQSGMSVAPRTSNLDRLKDNSATNISEIPDLDDKNLEIFSNAVKAILANEDMENDVYVNATFYAKSQDMYLFFYPGNEDDYETQIAHIPIGTSVMESTHPRHKFRLYDAYDPDIYKTVTVEGHYGDNIEIHVEL